jgi:hypothetical protein
MAAEGLIVSYDANNYYRQFYAPFINRHLSSLRTLINCSSSSQVVALSTLESLDMIAARF